VCGCSSIVSLVIEKECRRSCSIFQDSDSVFSGLVLVVVVLV
jgi:hypothetical protein